MAMPAAKIELIGKGRAASGGKKRLGYTGVRVNGVEYRRNDAVLMRSGDPKVPPYVGRLLQFRKIRGAITVKVAWYYRIGDTHVTRKPKYPNEVFESPTTDNNSVLTILRKAEVADHPVKGSLETGPFFCTRRYSPATGKFTPLPNIAKKPHAKNASAARGTAAAASRAKTAATPANKATAKKLKSNAAAPPKKSSTSSTSAAESTSQADSPVASEQPGSTAQKTSSETTTPVAQPPTKRQRAAADGDDASPGSPSTKLLRRGRLLTHGSSQIVTPTTVSRGPRIGPRYQATNIPLPSANRPFLSRAPGERNICVWAPDDASVSSAQVNEYLHTCREYSLVKRRLYAGQPVSVWADMVGPTPDQDLPELEAQRTRPRQVVFGTCLQVHKDVQPAEREKALRAECPVLPPTKQLLTLPVLIGSETVPRRVPLAAIVPESSDDIFLQYLLQERFDLALARRSSFRYLDRIGYQRMWSQPEILKFWKLLQIFPKQFDVIASNLKAKTTKDVIQFYYDSKRAPRWAKRSFAQREVKKSNQNVMRQRYMIPPRNVDVEDARKHDAGRFDVPSSDTSVMQCVVQHVHHNGKMREFVAALQQYMANSATSASTKAALSEMLADDPALLHSFERLLHS